MKKLLSLLAIAAIFNAHTALSYTSASTDAVDNPMEDSIEYTQTVNQNRDDEKCILKKGTQFTVQPK